MTVAICQRLTQEAMRLFPDAQRMQPLAKAARKRGLKVTSMDNDTFLNVEEGCLFLLALYPLLFTLYPSPLTPHPSPLIRTANDDWALEAFLFLMYNIIFKVKTIRNRDEICLR